jgi:hypothetical protein
MAADPGWAQATNGRASIPYERDVIAELDAENARLHGELIDVRCELATARHGYTQMWNRLQPVAMAARAWAASPRLGHERAAPSTRVLLDAVRTLDAS